MNINYLKNKMKCDNYTLFERKLDKFITRSKLTIPLFFVLLFIIFEITFSVGNFFANLIDVFANYIYSQTGIDNKFVNAVFGGIVGILVYIPNVFILYFFLYLFEDSGLLPRISYVFDKFLRRIGLSGNGFLSMFMGFGCTVPAIMSTSSIKNKKERILTVMMLPFISCSAKLPVFVLLISAFIPSYLQSITLISLYFLGIFFGIISNIILKNFLKYKKEQFIISLPNYKIPDFKNIFYKILLVLKEFIIKISVFIIPFSILLTLAFSYPSGEKIENTYGAKVGQTIGTIFRPLGFNDKMSISVVSGLVGKEVIVSTLGSLYYLDDTDSTDRLVKKMQNDKTITFASAMSFLVFILLYTSCIGAIFTAKIEIGNKWGFIFFAYPMIFAWIISFIVYNILRLFS